MVAPVRPSYCAVTDVTARLYSGQAVPAANPDTGRDALLASLIAATSRRFDVETGRPPGGFAPVYDARLFSGRGAQVVEVDEFAAVAKVEYNLTPAGSPSWQDVTSDFANGTMSALPMRYWPKSQLFRLSTFVVDPFRVGNVRISAVFGAVQPDMTQTPPVAPWQGLTTQAQINALSPDGLGGGWWITPEDVVKAVAEWTVYSFKAGQAGYGDAAGANAAPLTYAKTTPAAVQAVIDAYGAATLKLGMIAADGTDIADENVYGLSPGSPNSRSRWWDWQAYPTTAGGT